MKKLLVLSIAGTLLAASTGCQTCRTLWGGAAAPIGPPAVAPGAAPTTAYYGIGAVGNAPPALPAVAQPAPVAVAQPAPVAPSPYAGCAPAPLPTLSGPQNYTPITGR